MMIWSKGFRLVVIGAALVASVVLAGAYFLSQPASESFTEPLSLFALAWIVGVATLVAYAAGFRHETNEVLLFCAGVFLWGYGMSSLVHWVGPYLLSPQKLDRLENQFWPGFAALVFVGLCNWGLQEAKKRWWDPPADERGRIARVFGRPFPRD